MPPAPAPNSEEARLWRLRQTRLLDTPPEERFDRLTRLAQQIFEVPIALVSLVDRDRQWFKSVQGLDLKETPRSVSFCAHAVVRRDLMIVEDASIDPRVSDNALVTRAPGIRFYAGQPLITADGHALGTLCVIDTRPRALDRRQRDMLRCLGEMAMQMIEDRDAVSRAERAESLFAQAIEALPDGFALYDPEDRLVIANSRYVEIYDASAAAIVTGSRFEDILRAGLAQGQYPAAIGREEAWLAERLAAHRAGSVTVEQELPGDLWLRVVERPTPDGGRVGFRVDITDMKRQQRELEAARERAEAANVAKSAFLANMSHEIRTPMNGVMAMASALAQRPLGPDERAMVEVIEQSGELLLRILNDILDFSKIEAGKIEVERVPFTLADLARRTESLHSLRAREKGLDFNVCLIGDGTVTRLGDPARIQQVLHNGIGNAIKFTEAGEVRVGIDCRGETEVAITVTDTGIGMSPESAAQVFDRFSQADPSTTRRYGGTGLGLGILKGLVEAMGGRVGLTSELGRGTVLEVRLPLPRTAPGAEPAPTAAARATLPEMRSGLRILAAEDNEVNRLVLATFLTPLGAQLTIARDGREAVETYRPGAFDVVLLDISMPVMDGTEALALIRAADAAAGAAPVPAVAVTANAMDHHVAEYRAAGFTAHLAKPIRRAELIRTVALLAAGVGGAAAAE